MIYNVYIVTKDNSGTIVRTDVTSSTLIGFSVLENLDESLDFGSLVLSPMTKSDAYGLFDSVEIDIDGVTKFSQRISSDTVELVSKNPLLYKHTMQLIEHTKILELFTISGYTLTQPLVGTQKTVYDAIETLRNTYPLEVTSLVSSTRLFSSNSSNVP